MLNISHLPHLHMVSIPGGAFTQGPLLVHLSDFELGQYPVTQTLWEAVMGEGSNPSSFEGPRRPVDWVSWFDAVAFCNRLNAREQLPFCYFFDKKCTQPYALAGELPNQAPVYYKPSAGAFRLPTEAEWEYAARGGKYQVATEYAGSDRVGDLAWYGKNSSSETQPVGLLQPNPLGLYDLSWNVYEWCWDWYGDYVQTVQSNPSGPAEGNARVGRGGAWSNFGVRSLRVTNRTDLIPVSRFINVGFRLARHLTI